MDGPADLSRPLWSLQPHCTPTFGTPCAVSPIDPPYGAVDPALARRRCGGAPGDSESGVRIALALLDREIQHLREYRNRWDESEAHTSIPCGTREARGAQKIISLYLAVLASQLTKTARHPRSRHGCSVDTHRRQRHAGRVQRCAWAPTRHQRGPMSLCMSLRQPESPADDAIGRPRYSCIHLLHDTCRCCYFHSHTHVCAHTLPTPSKDHIASGVQHPPD